MALDPKTVVAKDRYNALTDGRKDALDRAKRCARVTIPRLYREHGKKPDRVTTPHQGIGANCLNSLTGRLLNAMLPANASVFKLSPDMSEMQDLMEQAGIQQGELELALAEVERTAINYIETAGVRPVFAKLFQHAVFAGNGAIYLPDAGGAKFYPLTQFVVDRDGVGNILEAVFIDSIAVDKLDQSVRDELDKLAKPGGPGQAKEVNLYTWVGLSEDGTKWEVFQEAEGVRIPDSDGQYDFDACPWIILALPLPDGEDYGAGLIDDQLGDFNAAEALSKAILKGAAAAAKILWMLDPNSQMREKDITSAESGAVLRGRKEDLSAATLDKYGDMQFVRSQLADLQNRLELAYGVRTAVQRSGERVTAEEIRMMASALDETLGGVYSILAEALMQPVIRRVLRILEGSGALPELPEGVIKPRITVGTAALGRGQDMNKLVQYGQVAKEVLGEQGFNERIDAGEWLARLGAAADISTKGLIKTDERLAQEQNEETMSDMATSAAGPMAGAVARGMTQGMEAPPM